MQWLSSLHAWLHNSCTMCRLGAADVDAVGPGTSLAGSQHAIAKETHLRGELSAPRLPGGQKRLTTAKQQLSCLATYIESAKPIMLLLILRPRLLINAVAALSTAPCSSCLLRERGKAAG